MCFLEILMQLEIEYRRWALSFVRIQWRILITLSMMQKKIDCPIGGYSFTRLSLNEEKPSNVDSF